MRRNLELTYVKKSIVLTFSVFCSTRKTANSFSEMRTAFGSYFLELNEKQILNKKVKKELYDFDEIFCHFAISVLQ